MYKYVSSTDRQEAFVTFKTQIRHLVYSSVEIGAAWFLISRRSVMYNNVEVSYCKQKIIVILGSRLQLFFIILGRIKSEQINCFEKLTCLYQEVIILVSALSSLLSLIPSGNTPHIMLGSSSYTLHILLGSCSLLTGRICITSILSALAFY
jgi:hypothetical protein